MRGLKNIRLLPVLMGLTILVIASFQLYWLDKSFERETKTLEMRTNYLFRETVLALQASKLKWDRVLLDSTRPTRILLESEEGDRTMRVVTRPGQKMAGLVNTLSKRAKDSLRTTANTIVFHRTGEGEPNIQLTKRQSRLMQFLYDMDSLQDSIKVAEIEAAYAQRLEQQGLEVPFEVLRLDTANEGDRVYNEVTLGFAKPVTYQLSLGNTYPFLFKRVSAAILFSVFLVGFTILSFMLLYRNLLKERRLATIKNEFISNITHELKTPIATVSVAIEALRNFNANLDARRTREYLDISANELQRLSLLVDKVLKLSMFENKEVELKYEHLNMQDLVAEVTASMRLQFEKRGAEVVVRSEGDTFLEGDRLHLVSVIFNLLDNALKYTQDKGRIEVLINGGPQRVGLCIRDNGIGIPEEYRDKIFEKFFRVPTGNLHNAKGYGLGLSYVAHVVSKHRGEIKVESAIGAGSAFMVQLPKQVA